MTERERETRTPEEQQKGSTRHCLDVMTDNPTCCLPADTVEHVAQLMQSENIGSVPVIDDSQRRRLVGIVTDRDLALKVVAQARDARQTRVEEVMSLDIVTCRPDDDLQSALDAMARHQVRRIPVVGEDRQIIGIIAQADIATRIEAPRKTAEVVERISQPGNTAG